uniref:MADF domain-containing protein n=1 Tax=Strongyloides stercoralis TaxID=6248 RepID=A0A0K0EKE8_STRER
MNNWKENDNAIIKNFQKSFNKESLNLDFNDTFNFNTTKYKKLLKIVGEEVIKRPSFNINELKSRFKWYIDILTNSINEISGLKKNSDMIEEGNVIISSPEKIYAPKNQSKRVLTLHFLWYTIIAVFLSIFR